MLTGWLRVVSLLAGVAWSVAWLSSALAQGPAPDYMVGPRDVLQITVWGQLDLSKDYPVDQDGFVSFPLLGRVKAAGLTTSTLAGRLTDLLGKDYLVNPQVSVSVKEYLSQKVHVLGEAEKPGLFYLTGSTTLLEVLSRAGGLSKTAGKQLILVRVSGDPASGRGNTILRFDLTKVQAGDASQNIRLEDQDTLFIPKAHAYFVLGEVKSAGTFPLDREVTVLEAVTIAGGFNDRAALAGVKLIRRAADGEQETISLDLASANSQDRNVRVREGDTLVVPKGNTFFVFGEVKRPGAYQLEKETNILEGITLAGGFTDKASPSRARVIRNTPTGQQVFDVDMNEILKRGQRAKAMLLQENDVVVVPESFF
jgi:polysaccharide export outer membrane protein